MDIKIGDDFDENGPVKHELFSKKTKIIFCIVIAILICFLIGGLYFAFTMNNKKEEEQPKVTKTTLLLTDKNVLASYKMVTYGYNEGRGSKFLLGVGLDIDSFSNEEKYYYALQYCVLSDLKETTEVDDKGNKIYTLPKSSMDIYMERVFGKDIKYDTSSPITNTFKFKINNYNTGTLIYDERLDLYKISLSSLNNKKELLEDVYYQLDKAYAYSDGRLIIEEKVIYTRMDDNNGKKSIVLFSNYNKTKTLGTITDIDTSIVTPDVVYENTDPEYYYYLPLYFNFDDYKDNAGTITYTFKIGEKGYYFVNSEVK